MSFGFPGSNTHLENHNVSEESFWPSFTDIMMVIVMVFLLVTVSVILNNYQLFENLKKSILAEQAAAAIAENVQVENSTLEEQLAQLKRQMGALSAQLSMTRKTLVSTETQLDDTEKEKLRLATLTEQQQKDLESQIQTIATLEKEKTEQLAAKDEQIQQLNQANASQLTELQEVKQKNASQLSALEQIKQQIETQKTLVASMREKESEDQSRFVDLQAQLADLQATLEERTTSFESLQQERTEDEKRLLSLQGELDTLDKKYQKLLRPARSSKGKFVASVSYSKRRGRDVYRLSTGPGVDFKTVGRGQLDRELSRLKEKHKLNLYVKVIIPENSGLSYNDAWRFTNSMQKSYDYYYQENESETEESTSDDEEQQSEEDKAPTAEE